MNELQQKQAFKEWVQTDGTNDYMKRMFTEYKIFKKDHTEIFISDDDLDSYWEENLGLTEMYYIVDYFLQSIDIYLAGEELAWFSDSIDETILSVYPISQLSKN